MKKCSYCGKEYGDDAAACAIDGQTLLDPDLPPVSPVEPAPVQVQSATKESSLTYPDYQWRAVDAWKCLGIIFLLLLFFLMLVMAISLGWFHAPPRDWARGSVVLFLTSGLEFFVFVFAAIYSSRTKTLASFWEAFGLNRKPSELVWFGIVIALFIRLSWYLGPHHGTPKGTPLNLFSLLTVLVFAPVFEELVNRGFLYKAFRGSYSKELSTVLMVTLTAATHFTQFRSLTVAVDLAGITVAQCYLREKSNSLWDCIICHFVFNASALLV